MHEAVIVDAVRTASAKGKPGGALSSVHPVDLLADVLDQLISRNGIDPTEIDDVIAGTVSQIGEQSMNVARNAVLAAGLPETLPATTIDRQCGSSQQAATFAAQAIMSGSQDVVVACGVESMSRVPLGSSLAGQDALGALLRERYPEGLVHQGVSAELIAAKWDFARAELDDFAARSHELAAAAASSGDFDAEIVPIATEAGPHYVDETIRAGTSAASLAKLQPAFATPEHVERFPELEWKVTPGNSSPLTDAASAVLIMSREKADALGLRPLARFVAFSVVGDDPVLMLTGPIPATERVLQRAGLHLDDIDIFEVNEAFSSVALAWLRETGAPPAKLNPRGGAIALGHAVGASGARLLTTLVHGLIATGGNFGLQTMCEGGGMANATIIERL